MLRPAVTVGALALALSTAACTPDQADQTLASLNVACNALQAGTQIAIQVAPLIPGGGTAVPIATTVGVAGQLACPILISSTKALVDQITDTGGTAKITAITTDPVTKLKTVRRMTVAPNAAPFFEGTISPGGGLF